MLPTAGGVKKSRSEKLLLHPLTYQAPASKPGKRPSVRMVPQLVASLRTLPLFARLTPSQLTAVASCMKKRELTAGEVLLRAGEPQNLFYLVASGLLHRAPSEETGSESEETDSPLHSVGQEAAAVAAAAAAVASSDAQLTNLIPSPSAESWSSVASTAHKRVLVPGDGIGTMALIFQDMPTKDVVAGGPETPAPLAPSSSGGLEDCAQEDQPAPPVTVVWSLTRRDFRAALAACATSQDAAVYAALCASHVLQQLSSSTKRLLATAVQEEVFEKGEYIVRKGTIGNAMYVLHSGVVACVDVPGGLNGTAATLLLRAGACFGERALLCGCPRAADVRSVTRVTTFRIDRAVVEAHLGPLAAALSTSLLFHALNSTAAATALPQADIIALCRGAHFRAYEPGAPVLAAVEPQPSPPPAPDSSPVAFPLAMADAPFSSSVPGLLFVVAGTVRVQCSSDSEAIMHPAGSLIGTAQRGMPWPPGVLISAGNAPASALLPGFIDGGAAAVVTLFSWDLAQRVLSIDAQHMLQAHAMPCTPHETSPPLPSAGSVSPLSHLQLPEVPLDPAEAVLASPARRRSSAIAVGSLQYLLRIARPLDDSMTFEDLERIALIGVGLFGRVWLVRHRQRNTFHAVKAMRISHLKALKQCSNVVFERAVLAAVQHPLLLQLQATLRSERTIAMVTEFVPGGELLTRLEEVGRFSETHAAFYIACLASALRAVHALQIVYRDLKLENCVLDAQGYARLIDMGFARHVPSGRTYTLCGTPSYMSPECITGRGYGKPADCWALGVLTVELLTGRNPYERESQMDTFKAILKPHSPWPRDFKPSAPCAACVEGLLQPSPILRLGSSGPGMRAVLEHAWVVRAVPSEAQLLEKAYEAPWKPELASECDVSRYRDDDADIEAAAVAAADAREAAGGVTPVGEAVGIEEDMEDEDELSWASGGEEEDMDDDVASAALGTAPSDGDDEAWLRWF